MRVSYLICGGPGTGKTTLANAIAQQYLPLRRDIPSHHTMTTLPWQLLLPLSNPKGSNSFHCAVTGWHGARDRTRRSHTHHSDSVHSSESAWSLILAPLLHYSSLMEGAMYQVAYGTSSVDHRVGFVVDPRILTLEAAAKLRRSYARQGLWAWVQTVAGDFVAVKGAMRRPKGYLAQL